MPSAPCHQQLADALLAQGVADWRYDRDPVPPGVAGILSLRHPTRSDFDVTNAYVAMTKENA